MAVRMGISLCPVCFVELPHKGRVCRRKDLARARELAGKLGGFRAALVAEVARIEAEGGVRKPPRKPVEPLPYEAALAKLEGIRAKKRVRQRLKMRRYRANVKARLAAQNGASETHTEATT